uniref:Serpin domain-containing protein n=1 Tax=Araucaria cunninghamii TaxID=56994 RepID=A0A0D6QZR2_ARACU
MDLHASIHSQTEFSLGFSKEVLAGSADKNAVFSPLGMSVALSLAAAGAKGPTLDQICTCLKLKEGSQLHEFSSQLLNVVLADGSPNGGPNLSFVNGVWVDQSMTLKPTFKDIVKKQYGTEARSVDFVNKANEVRTEVNTWVAEETKDKIKELLPEGSVDGSARLVLANALYFNGTWKKQFDSSKTKEGTFNLLGGGNLQVPMMTTAKKQVIKRIDDCKILRLPYVQGKDMRSFSMYFILPDETNGLPDLEKKVDLTFLEHHLSEGPEVKVSSFQLPRFKITHSLEATAILKKLGLVLPFSNEANFTEMVDSPSASSLSISNVFHKSFVEVNEEGTEAAAATGAVIKLRGILMEEPVEDFIADHPFMFVIKEEQTGVILFVGHVLNPLES